MEMVEIKLKDRENGYDVIGEYIKRYWNHKYIDTVVFSIETSYDGEEYSKSINVASYDCNIDGIEFLDDWWEGEKYIRLLGIRAINDLSISGGIYES